MRHHCVVDACFVFLLYLALPCPAHARSVPYRIHHASTATAKKGASNGSFAIHPVSIQYDAVQPIPFHPNPTGTKPDRDSTQPHPAVSHLQTPRSTSPLRPRLTPATTPTLACKTCPPAASRRPARSGTRTAQKPLPRAAQSCRARRASASPAAAARRQPGARWRLCRAGSAVVWQEGTRGRKQREAKGGQGWEEKTRKE